MKIKILPYSQANTIITIKSQQAYHCCFFFLFLPLLVSIFTFPSLSRSPSFPSPIFSPYLHIAPSSLPPPLLERRHARSRLNAARVKLPVAGDGLGLCVERHALLAWGRERGREGGLALPHNLSILRPSLPPSHPPSHPPSIPPSTHHRNAGPRAGSPACP